MTSTRSDDTRKSMRPTLGATVLGYPRIGRDRELKRALERYWDGVCSADELLAVATAVRADALRTMSAAGLDSVPVGCFPLYDHLLDAAVMVGAVPERFASLPGGGPEVADSGLATYFAMARGTADQPPLEMTKWFDTNYHVLVPEIGPGTVFDLHIEALVAEHAEARALGLRARPVVVGPYTLLSFAKPEAGSPQGFDPLDRLDDLVGVYVDLLTALHKEGVEWVQIDEPAAAATLGSGQVTAVQSAYDR
jgi:5-methyltetrahydropteroyltriglutamate--homocysteine methyltransferase